MIFISFQESVHEELKENDTGFMLIMIKWSNVQHEWGQKLWFFIAMKSG